MSRGRPIPSPRRRKRTELGAFIEEALKARGLSAASVAKALGVTRGYMSMVLAGDRRPSEDKLKALAEILELPPAQVRRLGGMPEPGVAPVRMPELSLLIPKGADHLRVVTDPRFFDSALFMWLFSTQPFRRNGLECELIATHWHRVPRELANSPHSIGFYNRRARIKSAVEVPVNYWSDLCLYKGYALFARKGAASPDMSWQQANRWLRRLIDKRKKEGRQPTLVYFGGDAAWKLRSKLTPDITPQNFKLNPEPNPDVALESFANGTHDLFMGGLPQRMKALQAGHVEVLSIRNNPLLFSVNSLIYPESKDDLTLGVPYGQALLAAATGAWFSMIQQIRASSELRERAIKEIPELLGDLGIQNHNVTEPFLRVVLPGSALDEMTDFARQAAQSEFFPDRPSELLDELMRTAVRVLELVATENEASKMWTQISRELEQTFDIRVEENVLL